MNLRDQQEFPQNEQHHKQGKSTATNAYFNFMKSLVGIGLVHFMILYFQGIIILPFVAFSAGWLLSILLLLPILFCMVMYTKFSYFARSTNFLIQIADDLENRFILYSDIARVTLGGCWTQVIEWLIIIGQIGLCCAYLIFLTQFAQIQASHYGLEMNRLTFLLITTIVIIPLTMVSNMHYFHKASTFGFSVGLIAIIITLGYTIWFYFFIGKEIHFEQPFKIEGTFNFVGVGIITFEGIMTVLPIRDSMADMKMFQNVFNSSVLTNFFLCFTMFELNILLLTDVKEIFLFNIQNYELQLITSSLYAISLLLCYPLQIFVALQIIDQKLEQRRYEQISDEGILKSQAGSQNNDEIFTEDMTSIFQRLFLTIIIYLVAYYVPNIVLILNLLGNVIGSLLQYVFPVLFHMIHFKGAIDLPYIKYSFVLFFSTLALIFGPIEFIQNIRNH